MVFIMYDDLRGHNTFLFNNFKIHFGCNAKNRFKCDFNFFIIMDNMDLELFN